MKPNASCGRLRSFRASRIQSGSTSCIWARMVGNHAIVGYIISSILVSSSMICLVTLQFVEYNAEIRIYAHKNIHIYIRVRIFTNWKPNW